MNSFLQIFNYDDINSIKMKSIKIENVSKSYGKIKALDELGFNVNEGEI
jgi:ABC-type sugar transport system ATPase subunit